MLFPVVFRHVELRDCAMLHRDARVMYALRIAGNQRMPVIERLALVKQLIGAGFGQPVGVALNRVGFERDAFRYELLADGILRAAAGGIVEQATGDSGQLHLASLVILQLVEAAFATAVAERPPFLLRHPVEAGGLPEARAQSAAVDGIAHSAASMSRARAQSASICAMKESRPSKVSSGRR